jgi:hypothetical protein
MSTPLLTTEEMNNIKVRKQVRKMEYLKRRNNANELTTRVTRQRKHIDHLVINVENENVLPLPLSAITNDLVRKQEIEQLPLPLSAITEEVELQQVINQLKEWRIGTVVKSCWYRDHPWIKCMFSRLSRHPVYRMHVYV